MESILIVDDEDIIAQNMAIKLKHQGYNNTYTAKSGKQALKIIEEKQPDLILADIVLEGKMSGIELAQQVKNIPVIFVSAFTDEVIKNNAKNASSFDYFGYLVKPFQQKELKNAIDEALGKCKME